MQKKVAHDFRYDPRICRIFQHLPSRGIQLILHSAGHMRMGNVTWHGRSHYLICSSYSVSQLYSSTEMSVSMFNKSNTQPCHPHSLRGGTNCVHLYKPHTLNYCKINFFKSPLTYEGEPKSNWTLNLVRKLEVVVRCAARCCGSTQYSSSLPRGVNLG